MLSYWLVFNHEFATLFDANGLREVVDVHGEALRAHFQLLTLSLDVVMLLIKTSVSIIYPATDS